MSLVKKLKPRTPSTRFVIRLDRSDLSKDAPAKSLLRKLKKNGGRNNTGRITVRHQGGGHKRHYRLVDFKRNKDGINAIVEAIEYDPNRSANIALVLYADGERRYILSPKGLEKGMTIASGSNVAIKVGNTLPLRNIPVGSTIHCLEMKPGKGCTDSPKRGYFCTIGF